MVKKIMKWIINAPNVLFIVLMALYVFYKIMKNTSESEMALKMDSDESLATPEIKEYMEKFYPLAFRITIAVVFYLYVIKVIYENS